MVRRIRREELPELLTLYRLFHPEEPAADPAGVETLKLWQAILANPDLRYYVVEADGRIVSTCTLTLIPNLNHNLKPYGLIENVVTNPDYRRRGFATTVLRHALREAWETGCYKVMLLTGSNREETLRFYEQAGFQRGVKTGFIAYPE
jgi:GNAT superfamily N-acetyltransferase